MKDKTYKYMQFLYDNMHEIGLSRIDKLTREYNIVLDRLYLANILSGPKYSECHEIIRKFINKILSEYKNCTTNGIPDEEIIKDNTSCLDCKHRFFIDSHLECYLFNRMNDKHICTDFELKEK